MTSSTTAIEVTMKRLLETILKEDRIVPDYRMYWDLLTALCERDSEIETIFNSTVHQLCEEGVASASQLPTTFDNIVPRAMFADKNEKQKITSKRVARRDINTGETVYGTIPAEQVCFSSIYLYVHH